MKKSDVFTFLFFHPDSETYPQFGKIEVKT